LWRYFIPLVYLAYGKKNFVKTMEERGLQMPDMMANLAEVERDRSGEQDGDNRSAAGEDSMLVN